MFRRFQQGVRWKDLKSLPWRYSRLHKFQPNVTEIILHLAGGEFEILAAFKNITDA